MRSAGIAAVAAAALLLLPACGGEEEVAAQVGLRVAAGVPAPGAAEVFQRFVAAAARGDAVEMWGHLSSSTQASVGPTLERFRWSAALELRKSAGAFVGEPELVLARAFGPRWAVAAVAGEVVREGTDGPEPGAFGAALRREDDRWRLELDGIFFVGHQPSPLSEAEEAQPLLGATAQSSARIERMVLWLDGEPVGARATRPQPFTGTIAARATSPLRPGVHVLTVFAATEETAAAEAWPFEVEE